MQTKQRRRNCNEVLLNNRVDSAFNNMLLPLNLLQQIMFLQKYRIRDKFVTPNDKITNLVTFCVLIGMIALNAYHYLTIEFRAKPFLKIATIVIELVIVPIALLINFAHIVLHSNTHVMLFLKLQRLAKFTTYSKYKYFTILNWIGIVVLTGHHASLVILWYVISNLVAWPLIIMLLIHSYMFYISRFVNLLRRTLLLWTDKIKTLNKINTTTEEEPEIINGTESCAELFNFFRDILESFSIVKKTFEFMVRINSD